MAYMQSSIQREYNVYQDIGLLGQVSIVDNNTYFFETAAAGVELRPGDGVYLDTAAGATQGQWLRPTTDAEQILVTHIVSFDPASFNTPLAAPSGNQTNEVVFPAGTPQVKAFVKGSTYVRAGANIVRGQALVYDQATSRWVPTTLNSKSLVVALENGSDGDVIRARLNDQVVNAFESPNPIFTFFAAGATWSGGLATLDVTVNGALTTDGVLANIASAPTEAAYLESAEVTAADTVTFTLSAANTSNDAVIYFEVRRAQS